jgi:hypothetical protein
MSNYGNAFFTPDSKSYPASVMPVWLEVKRRKIAGGTFSLSGVAKGTIYPAGMPVRLDKMGGTVTLLPTFTVVGNVASDGTTLVLKPQTNIIPAEDMIVGKMTSAGVAAKAVALGAATHLTGTDAGKYQFTITANSLGTLSDGDLLVIVSASGSNKAAVLPNGLSWRQVVVDSDNATYGTIAVVTDGQVLADRIPAMPDFYKEALPGIDFEYELS